MAKTVSTSNVELASSHDFIFGASEIARRTGLKQCRVRKLIRTGAIRTKRIGWQFIATRTSLAEDLARLAPDPAGV